MVIAWSLTAAFVAILLLAEAKGHQNLRRIAKLFASIGFVVTAGLTTAPSTTVGRWVLAALVLSLVGDLLLLGKEKRTFLLGLVAFLLGHLAYVGAFIARGVAPYQVLVGIVGLLLVATVVWRWLLPHLGSMKLPVLAYMFVISLMVATAFGSCRLHGEWIIFLGAVLFYLSDLCVAKERFVGKAFGNKLLGLPLYYTAQILLASYLPG